MRPWIPVDCVEENIFVIALEKIFGQSAWQLAYNLIDNNTWGFQYQGKVEHIKDGRLRRAALRVACFLPVEHAHQPVTTSDNPTNR